MVSRLTSVAVAVSLALAPTAWRAAQPRVVHADSVGADGSEAISADRALESVPGIQAWVRILALSDTDDPVRRAPTLFVPSDGAMRALPDGTTGGLAGANGRYLRRAFLARSATEQRLDFRQIAGRRIQLSTLDGRALVIDATGGEIRVGDAEAIEVRTLPDGRLLFILDGRVSEGSDAQD